MNDDPFEEHHYERQWVDLDANGMPRVLTFDEVEELGLDGTLRS